MGSLLLSPGTWCAQDFVCVLQEWSLSFPMSCGSPAIKSHCPSKSNSLGIPTPSARFPKLGSLMWGLEPSQQWGNRCGIVVLQFVGPSPGRNGIWFYRGCASPTVLLWLLLCLWTWGITFGGFQCHSVNSCWAASCDFRFLAGEGEHTSFYSTNLNQFPFVDFLMMAILGWYLIVALFFKFYFVLGNSWLRIHL